MPSPGRFLDAGHTTPTRGTDHGKSWSKPPRCARPGRLGNTSTAGLRAVAYVACAGALAFLSACSSLPTVRTHHSVSGLTGRLSVRIEATTFSTEKSFSASFALAGSDAQGQIELTSPIGTMLAQARWMPEGAWLATSQGQSPYPSMQQLTREVFGETIPVAPWFDWLRGKPWPGAASEPRADNLPGFVQDGWTVDLERLPDRLIVARREQPPAVTLRIKLDASD